MPPPAYTLGILQEMVHRLFASEMHSLTDSSLALSLCLIISGCLNLFQHPSQRTVLMCLYKEPHLLHLGDLTPLIHNGRKSLVVPTTVYGNLCPSSRGLTQRTVIRSPLG